MSTSIVIAVVVVVLVLLAAPFVVTSYLFAWHHRKSSGMSYFGLRAAERESFRKKLERRRPLVEPMSRLLGSQSNDPNQFTIEYEGIRAPSNSCSEETFAAAARYRPTEEDVFVATQMKCGTTWMLQLVYEVLMRGEGDLSDSGHGHLSAVSPWIECFNGVDMPDAPLIGAERKRIIKTHLPASLCPYGEDARYIYVTRHPVSCFRSTAEFYESVAGPMTPDTNTLLDWFCSDAMWWGSWPDHVAGFWEWSQRRSNVLFVHFEEMKDDLPEVVRRVAAFLGVALSAEELERVVEKCGFQYMKEREGVFEMTPPTFFSVGGTFFKSGKLHDEERVGEKARARIVRFCADRLAGSEYPAAEHYPDLASPPVAE